MRAAAARAAGAWKVASLQGRLAELAAAADTPAAGPRARRSRRWPARRQAEARRAIEALADRGRLGRDPGDGAGGAGEHRPEGRRAADRRLARPAAGRRAGDAEAVLGRVRWAVADGPAVAGRGAGRRDALPADVAKLGIRAGPRLGPRRARAGRRAVEGRQAGRRRRSRSTPERDGAAPGRRRPQGDPARGEAVFRRKELTCLKCHAIAGAGGQVGPGLESIGASAPVDYLLDSLLEPNKAVKENYHAIVVATDDGRVVTGIKVRQTDTELVLRDAEDREVAIPLALDRGAEAGRLADARRPDRRADPRRAGRPRPVPLRAGQGRPLLRRRPGASVRRWQVLEPTPEARDALARGGPEAVLRDDRKLTWRPAYTTVAGLLPPSEWAVAAGAGASAVRRPRADADPGDDRRARSSCRSTRPRGSRSISTAVASSRPGSRAARAHWSSTCRRACTRSRSPSRADRRDGIRCILEDVPGSPARAQVVLGK